MIKDVSKTKRNIKNDHRKLDSRGMDIPDYAYERMAKCLLPIMRNFFESEKAWVKELVRSEENGKAA